MAMGNKPSCEKPQENKDKQIVLYDPKIALENQKFAKPQQQDPIHFEPSPPQGSNPGPSRGVIPTIGSYTVQCAVCFKWRVIPTKQRYEKIREFINEEPFYCEVAREWKDDVSCDVPTDVEQDNSRVWAMDRPSIAQAPPGWVRELRFRAEGSSKFADVYYISPLRKRLRSKVEVQKYLSEHPEFTLQGVTLSQFSFQIPKPLREDYVRKRAPPPAAATPAIEAMPLSWVPPTDPTKIQLAQTDDVTPPVKKKARPSSKHSDKSSPLKLSPHNVKIEGPHPPNGVNEV